MLSTSNPPPKTTFWRRHPVLRVFGILFVAMALSVGAMAFFSSAEPDEDGWVFWPDSEKLGLVRIEGTIESSERVVAFLRKLREDKDVKGVLVRVNSGGGGFGPSQEIHRAVARVATVKPVVASFGSAAASGGYYAACSAKAIFALPGTITGSIGVRSQVPTVLGLTDKIGLTFHNFATGRLKDAGSPFKDLSPEDKAYFEGLLADLYDIFAGDVVKARNVSRESIDALQGKAITGVQAQGLGLVDAMGGQEEAMDELKRLAGVTKKHPTVIRGPKREHSRWEEFFGMLGRAFADGAASGTAFPGPRAE